MIKICQMDFFYEKIVAILSNIPYIDDIMSTSERESAKPIQREQRIMITIDFEKIVKHEVRIVIL